MRVVVCRTSFNGLAYYRAEEPARAVVEAGVGVEVVVVPGLATTMSTGPDPVVLDVDDLGADVVVMQLPKTAEMLQCLRVLQARGVAVVVEVDDLLHGASYGLVGHLMAQVGAAQRVMDCAREADLVTVTTPVLLKEYARHGRGAVVPNAVPRRVAELPPAYERRPDQVVVGWTGNVLGHPYDLQEMGSGLQQALDATAGHSEFVVVGQKWDAAVRLGLRAEPREVPWVNAVDDYLALVGSALDIGLAPLRVDRFNTAKSWLKVLEYAARGVVAVRSPIAEYDRLGLGYRARAPRDWAKAVTRAVQDPGWRIEQARAAREVVLERHLVEHRVPQWVAAWEQATAHRAAALGKAAVTVG